MPPLVHASSYLHVFDVNRFAGTITGIVAGGARPSLKPAAMGIARKVTFQAHLIATVYDLKRLDPYSKELQEGLVLWRALLHQWSNNHYQYSQGVLEEALFTPTEREISAHAIHPGSASNFRFAWESEQHIYNDGFRKFVTRLLTENPI